MTRGFRHLQILKALLTDGQIPVGSPRLSHQTALALERKGLIRITLNGMAKTATITDAGHKQIVRDTGATA